MNSIYSMYSYCALPEKIHTHPKEGHWKFLGGGGVLKARILEAKCEAKLDFPGGGGVQNKKPSMGGVWIFSGTAHFWISLKHGTAL